MRLIAHLTNIDGIRYEQSLKEHCMHTAEYAAECAGSVKLRNTVYLAGLLHDAGKAKLEFVEYLEAAYEGCPAERGTVNHTFTGVIWLLETFHTRQSGKWEQLASEIIAYAVGAHHGLFDCTDLEGKNGFLHRLQESREGLHYEEALENYFSQVIDERTVREYFQKSTEEIREFFETAARTCSGSKKDVCSQLSMLVRLVLSAVIYGDRRDTSEFMGQNTSRKPPRKPSSLSWEKRRTYFERKAAQLDPQGPLNQVRADISRQCLAFAEKPSHIYRLNVPTGAGKTLCTLRYALAHAERYNKKRIIFIIPLLSILDQNVKVIRDFLPDEREVLEHHSNVMYEADQQELLDTYELLTEDWNAPVIVSTMVQLLDILFKHKTSSIRRMQALCDSVIVIDEVQSLPKKVTIMFNRAMNFLQQFCNASIVLSSATQPCFEELKWPLRLAESPDMVQLTPDQMHVFERTTISDHTTPYGMEWEECVSFCSSLMERHLSLLVVCNTKAQARILFEQMQEQADEQGWEVFHLSTSMCQKHRLKALEAIRHRLSRLQEQSEGSETPKRLICISTQLIEAGVDISFSGAVRVLAGIDNLAQTAGRCNRNGEYGKTGDVYLINLKQENLSMLQEIKAAQKSTRAVIELLRSGELKEEDSLIGGRAAASFYRRLFRETEGEIFYKIKDFGETYYMAELLANDNPAAKNKENRDYILHQPFKTAGTYFSVFDENTTDVLVPYEDGEALCRQLRDLGSCAFPLSRLSEYSQIMQKAKPYTIRLYEYQIKKLDEAGLLYSLLEGRVLVLDRQAYDEAFGLKPLEQQPVENFIL